VSQPGSSQQEKGKGSTQAANPKVSRGQKGKLKKIKEKYAEQDEEEREIRMALLAVIIYHLSSFLLCCPFPFVHQVLTFSLIPEVIWQTFAKGQAFTR